MMPGTSSPWEAAMPDESAPERPPIADDHDEPEEQPRGTLLLMLLFLVATSVMWFYIYSLLLRRA